MGGHPVLCFRLRAGDLDLAEAGGFWYADPSARSPDIQFHFLPGSGLEAGVTKLCEHGCTLNSCFLRPGAAARSGWLPPTRSSTR